MKRLWVCALLLLCAAAICVCSSVGVQRVATKETALLRQAAQALQTDDTAAAMDALRQCEDYWKTGSRAFYLFLDHNFFNDFEYKLFHIRDYAALNKGLALENIGYCIAVMQDQHDAQKPVIENIL